MSSNDAFISYSHAADGRLAPAVQAGMQRLAKSWRQRRALSVFRDETGLATNPHLWKSIESALDDSDWFVLLASPESAASRWVQREVDHWLTTKPLDHLLIVVTDGDFVCRDGAAPDRRATTCLPTHLLDVLVSEPRWLDLRWAHADTQLDLRNVRFRDAIADLSAPIRGVAKEDLESEDVRQQRKVRRLARSAVAAVVVLATVAGVTAAIAVRQRNESARQRDLATSNAATAETNAKLAQANERKALAEADEASFRALVARSASSTDTDRSASLLLAVEANRRRPHVPESTGALFTALTADPSFVGYLRADTLGFTAVVVDSERDLAMAGTIDGKLVRWRLSDRAEIGDPFFVGELRNRRVGDVTRLAIGGGVLVAATNSGGGTVYDEVSARPVATFASDEPIESIAVSDDGTVFAVGGSDGRLEVRSTSDASIVAARPGIAQGTSSSRQQLRSARIVAFAPDGLLVSGDLSGSIDTYRPADLAEVGQHLQGLAEDDVSADRSVAPAQIGLEVSSDGTQLWWATDLGAQRFDRASGAEVWSVKDPTGSVYRLRPGAAFDPSTGRVFLDSEAGVRSWNEAGADRSYDPQGGNIGGVATDSKVLAVGSADVAVVALWGIDGRSAIGRAYAGPNTYPTNFSPDGSRLMVNTPPEGSRNENPTSVSGGTYRVVDLSTGEADAIGQFRQAFLMADNQVVAVSGDLTVRGISATTGQIAPLPQKIPFSAYSYVEDAAGRRIALGSVPFQSTAPNETDLSPGAVLVLDSWGRQVGGGLAQSHNEEAGATRQLALAFSPDGRMLVVGTSSEATVLEMATGSQIATLPGFASAVSFTSDGRELIVGDAHGSARRYITSTWTPSGAPIAYSKNDAYRIQPRADGTLVAASSSGVQLSDIASGAQIGRALALPSALNTTISPDGMEAASRNSTGTGIVVWNLNIASWPDAACLAAGRNLTMQEWAASFGSEPYRLTCDQWPSGVGAAT